MEKKNRLSFYDQIAKNKIKSFFLIAIITVFIIALAAVIGQIYGDIFTFLVFGIIISLVYTLIGYYGSAKMALWGVGAQPADPREYRDYHNIVEGLTLASGLPKPQL